MQLGDELYDCAYNWLLLSSIRRQNNQLINRLTSLLTYVAQSGVEVVASGLLLGES